MCTSNSSPEETETGGPLGLADQPDKPLPASRPKKCTPGTPESMSSAWFLGYTELQLNQMTSSLVTQTVQSACSLCVQSSQPGADLKAEVSQGANMCFCQSLLSCLALAFCLDPETKLHKKHEVSPNLGNVNQPLQTNKRRGGICKQSRSEKQKQMNGALHPWT